MNEEIKIVSKEEVLALFEQLLPWDKAECMAVLATKYRDLLPSVSWYE